MSAILTTPPSDSKAEYSPARADTAHFGSIVTPPPVCDPVLKGKIIIIVIVLWPTYRLHEA